MQTGSQATKPAGSSIFAVNYFTYDGHGSTRELTSPTGTVTDRYDYDGFGILAFNFGSTANAYRYSGEQYDADLGLYHLRARYLNSDSGRFWSTAYLPTAHEPDEYECTFAPDRAVFRRVDGDVEVRTEIVVSPEDDVEVRRVSMTNLGTTPRRLELTSYAEVVLAPPDADLSHPAFSNLFVETRSVPGRDALIASRRPRSGNERRFLVHLVSGRGPGAPAAQFETDRAKFIGRGGTLDRPRAMTERSLSNTTGPVLDPVVSLRRSIRLAPGASARITFATGYAENEASALQLIDKYADRRAISRAIALAAAHVPIELRHLGLTIEETFAFQRLGGRLLSGDPRLRDLEAIERNQRGQRDLWKFGISGDLPIVVARVTDDSGVPLVADLLKAHEYLRLKGLPFDVRNVMAGVAKPAAKSAAGSRPSVRSAARPFTATVTKAPRSSAPHSRPS